MNQTTSPHKKKVFITKSFKYLVAAFSIASTLGLWGIFSKQDVQSVSTDQSQSNLQPLPTVMPLNTAQINTSSVSSTPTDPLAYLPVATQPPSTITSSQGNIQIIQPNPVTQTRSSRK